MITIRDWKGAPYWVSTFPGKICSALSEHLERVKLIHEIDLAQGYGEMYLPYALARKYPNAGKEWGWQYFFQSDKRSIDPLTGKEHRHHLDPSPVKKAIKKACRQAGINKRVSALIFRHSFATHLLQRGTRI